MTNQSPMARLSDLIEAERQALLDGDFDRIAELMEDKENLATELDQSAPDEDELAPIRDGLRRNQELFDQALAGIRNVANRLGNLNRLRKTLDTYDENGRRTTLTGATDKKLERRA